MRLPTYIPPFIVIHMNFKIILLVPCIIHDLLISLCGLIFSLGLITYIHSRASLYAEMVGPLEINRKFAYLWSLGSITENSMWMDRIRRIISNQINPRQLYLIQFIFRLFVRCSMKLNYLTDLKTKVFAQSCRQVIIKAMNPHHKSPSQQTYILGCIYILAKLITSSLHIYIHICKLLYIYILT